MVKVFRRGRKRKSTVTVNLTIDQVEKIQVIADECFKGNFNKAVRQLVDATQLEDFIVQVKAAQAAVPERKPAEEGGSII